MFKTIQNTAVAISLAFSSFTFACDGSGGILPDNDFKIPVYGKGIKAGITEAQFNSVISKVETLYAPIVASKGGKLAITRKWTDGTVNAYAKRTGNTWEVYMFGGLARHETITEDGMALVVCHELGHHLGGAPKKKSIGWLGGQASAWATNEGGADYFAGLKCLRQVFLNDNNAQIVRNLNAPDALVQACKKSYKSNTDDTSLCIRIGMAGKSVSNLFSVLSKLPETKFDTPDKSVVRTTDDAHPKAQCRLDTYFQAALCDVSFNEDVSDTDENKGVCSIKNGNRIGNRPLCWFKPKI